jgi:hypothetical protein
MYTIVEAIIRLVWENNDEKTNPHYNEIERAKKIINKNKCRAIKTGKRVECFNGIVVNRIETKAIHSEWGVCFETVTWKAKEGKWAIK